jgi:hypothetical protein
VSTCSASQSNAMSSRHCRRRHGRSFLSGTTSKTLVHKLGCAKPRTTKDLLDMATNHASGKEALGVIFIKGEGKEATDKEAKTGL